MKRIDLNDLDYSKPLPCALYSRTGAMLVRKGADIRQKDLALMRGFAAGVYILERDAELVLGAAADVEEPTAEQAEAERRAAGAVDLETAASRQVDDALADGSGLVDRGKSIPIWLRRGLSGDGLRAEVERQNENTLETVTHYLQQAMGMGEAGLCLHETRAMLRGFADAIAQDASLAPLLVRTVHEERDYIYRHGVNAALIGMLVASRMGYAEDDCVELAIGALYSDLGMLRVPEKIRLAPRRLNLSEWLVMQRHPIYTLDALDRAEGVSVLNRIVCYQLHEREDRSGYPRCRPGAFIHPLAKVLAVADAYTDLVCERPHRKGLLPYQAMRRLLNEVARKRLDGPCVRALLDSVSLFPVGSFVMLDDGRACRVTRSNGPEHTRPIVQPVDEAGEDQGGALDLALLLNFKIVRAIDGARLADELAAGPEGGIEQAA